MTKDYGLPGLRLGYAVARQEIIDSLRRVCPPWNVNIIAQKVGTAVLKNEEYLEQSLLTNTGRQNSSSSMSFPGWVSRCCRQTPTTSW